MRKLYVQMNQDNVSVTNKAEMIKTRYLKFNLKGLSLYKQKMQNTPPEKIQNKTKTIVGYQKLLPRVVISQELKWKNLKHPISI